MKIISNHISVSRSTKWEVQAKKWDDENIRMFGDIKIKTEKKNRNDRDDDIGDCCHHC